MTDEEQGREVGIFSSITRDFILLPGLLTWSLLLVTA